MVAALPRSVPPATRRPVLRILTAVPLCDGHDSAITTINLELARRGMEVIYLGYHQSASAIARAAVQEDVQAIGLSSYNGGHVVFFREVIAQLRALGAEDIAVFGGGGGTITTADERALRRAGVSRIFFAGTPLDEIVRTIEREAARASKPGRALVGDRALARAITLAETKSVGAALRREESVRSRRKAAPPREAVVVGVAGPGGAGKSTLIDELVARFLVGRSIPAEPTGLNATRGSPGTVRPTQSLSDARVAVLANDPSRPDSGGAILGDRVSAIYARGERVFFRSLATRGSTTGLSAAVPAAIELLQDCGAFDLIFVESTGIGQDGDPFQVFAPGRKLVDAVLLVMSPHYGGRIQLDKIALLNGADLVVLNKCDDPRATTARVELEARLRVPGGAPAVHLTVAAQHDDPGVDQVYAALAQLAHLDLGGTTYPQSEKVSP